MLEPLRHFYNAKFGGVIFRRTTVQVRNEGGLWDESMNIYGSIPGAKPHESSLEWSSETGWRMKFAHLEYDRTVLDWQGSQSAYIAFDELSHFSEYQFWYMLSRLRSSSGVPGYIRATTNPDPDSWVRRFIDWWIGPDGYPIPERSGKVRWFVRVNESMVWADSEEELYEEYGDGPEIRPKSVTFIAAKLEDNQILMQKDPGYLANLLALNKVDRLRLKEGNWNIRASSGTLFRSEWFPVLDTVPGGWVQSVRFWDRSATKPHEGNKDPDWTRGLKLLKYPNGTYLVADLKSDRDTPGKIENLIKNVAAFDSHSTRIMCQQDPGSAGVSEAEHFIRMLSGYDVRTVSYSKDKVTRAKAVSAQAEAGNIFVLRAPWNHDFFRELENFPEGAHDDIVDALSGSYNSFLEGLSFFDVM